jgi:lathosterol oxidase
MELDSSRRGEPRTFGHGWISGTLGVALGASSVLAVLCFHFPAVLTTPELRQLLPLPWVRRALAGAIALAFVLSALSLALRRRKALGSVGLACALAAVLLGGSGVPESAGVQQTVFLGLDWFVLSALLTALVFVPLERAWPLRGEQRVLRAEWNTDLAWFAASHLGVQLLAVLVVAPATALAGWIALPWLRAATAALPLGLQVPLAVLVADLAQYGVHRAFHRVPWLWRFHRVHHSVATMDWLAGSRLHLVDIVATRGAVLAVLLACGFSSATLGIYLAWVGFHAVFVHANFAARLAWLEPWLATPRYHHWHHAADPAARDKNFAVHLPLIDRLFGTQHLPPGVWPERYGLLGEAVPQGFWRQLFLRSAESEDAAPRASRPR